MCYSHSLDNLFVYQLEIPGNFGINLKVPFWKDKLNIPCEELLKYSNTIISQNLYLKDNEEYHGTAFWKTYNVFSLDNNSISELKKQITDSYKLFSQSYGFPVENKLWINGWLNILPKGSYVKKHYHSAHSNSYLSGIFSLTKDSKTATNFYVPQFEHLDEYGVKKEIIEKNDLLFFPQWLFHSVDIVEDCDFRITIGFDLFTESAINYFTNNPSNNLIANTVRLY